MTGHPGDNATGANLAQLVERIEHLEDEKSLKAEEIKEVYAEAKEFGFNTRIIRAAVRRRAMKKEDREEFDTLLEMYERYLT